MNEGANNLIIGQGGHGDATAAATPWPVIAVVVGAIVALAAVMMMKRDDPRSSLERRFRRPSEVARLTGRFVEVGRSGDGSCLPPYSAWGRSPHLPGRSARTTLAENALKDDG